MLQRYFYSKLTKETLIALYSRNNVSVSKDIQSSVFSIVETVQKDGDVALFNYAKQFDNVQLSSLYVEELELQQLASAVPEEEKKAIHIAYRNIKKFHESQIHKEDIVETMQGVSCWREARAIEKVGLYVPGGSAVLPSTLLMLGVPATIAGCKEIVVCSPPQKNGNANPHIAYCLGLLGIKRLYLVGGAQAIAAMAYGTPTIPKVDKIFGPGNLYVTYAKILIQSNSNTAIDMPAGPSEVLVIADETCNPKFVAADMLAQAEHGADSQSVLVSTSEKIIDAVTTEIGVQLAVLSRSTIASKAIANSYAIVVDDLYQAIDFSNEYAPEHLILATDWWRNLIPRVNNAGSVFLGHLTPESAGDYASGTNHTLPTSAYAKSYSGVSLDSFIKKITFQYITPEGVRNIGETVEILAQIESLDAHKNAMAVRKSYS